MRLSAPHNEVLHSGSLQIRGWNGRRKWAGARCDLIKNQKVLHIYLLSIYRNIMPAD